METTATMTTTPHVIRTMITKFKAEEIAHRKKNEIPDDDVIVLRAKYQYYAGHPNFPDYCPIDEEERKNKRRRHKIRKESKREEKRRNRKGPPKDDTASGGNENIKKHEYLRNEGTTTTSGRNGIPSSHLDTPPQIEVEENGVRTGNIITRKKESWDRNLNMHPVHPVISVLSKGLAVRTKGKTVLSNTHITVDNINSSERRSSTTTRVPSTRMKQDDPHNPNVRIQPTTLAAGSHITWPGVSLVDTECRVVKVSRSHEQIDESAAVVPRQERSSMASRLPPDYVPTDRSSYTTSPFQLPAKYNFTGFSPVSLSTPCSSSSSRGVSPGGKRLEEVTHPLQEERRRPVEKQRKRNTTVEATHLNESPFLHTIRNKKVHIAGDDLFSRLAPHVININASAAVDNTENQVPDESAERQSKLKKSKPSLPKNSVAIMRSWLYVHRHRPYPLVEEKQMFEKLTNLTTRQVTDWFINARRRDLPKIREEEVTNPEHFLKTILPQHVRNITVIPSNPSHPGASSTLYQEDGFQHGFALSTLQAMKLESLEPDLVEDVTESTSPSPNHEKVQGSGVANGVGKRGPIGGKSIRWSWNT